mmetsp:Transcript_26024/g.58867  ORF Transcript_26024/g.58867 Transcript_26024/m.58867 type:complete len:2813 (-) Transcript_26024:149-8587(-)
MENTNNEHNRNGVDGGSNAVGGWKEKMRRASLATNKPRGLKKESNGKSRRSSWSPNVVEERNGKGRRLDVVQYTSQIAKKALNGIGRRNSIHDHDGTASTAISAVILNNRKGNQLKSSLKSDARGRSSQKSLVKRQRIRFVLPQEKTAFFNIDLLEPDNVYISSWLYFFVIPLAYELWAGGFRLALGSPSTNGWLFYLDLMCDILFLVDGVIYVNTVQVLQMKGTHEKSSAQAVSLRDRKAIFNKYMFQKFPLELLPSLIFLPYSKSSTPLYVWWILMMPRFLPRSYRLYRFFRSMEMNLSVSISKLQLIKFALVIIMSSHWIGCLYFWVARIQNDNDTTWISQISTFFPLYSNTTTTPQKYLLCLYKGFDGLSSIGYVPVVPNNALEMILSILVMYNSIFISAYILGSLFHYLLVSQKDPLTEAHRKRMADVITFAEARRLPAGVRKKLIQHFEFQYKKSVQRKASASLKLPRSLEVKVANSRFRPTIDKCCRPREVFFRCNPQFLNNLATQLRPVFLMPGDQFIRANEMVLELSFVIDGSVEVVDDDTIKKVIRSDVEDPSIIGEISFFLGVVQQYSVRAPVDADIELLVLSKEAAQELFANYPEQMEIITKNILSNFNLDLYGNDLVDNERMVVEEAEDPDAIVLRKMIQDTVKRRQEEAFLSLSYAATAGDIEEVKRVLRKGVGINSCNYDGKTVLHMAASEGNYRVVELLLEEGALKNQKDRWGNTPLQDAINCKQGPVVQLLVQWKCELDPETSTARLAMAAHQGELETLKLIIQHGITPNTVDADSRTPLHLAASQGHDKVIEYLISMKADVNAKDRWGRTPLQDAVENGHVHVAEQIHYKGGLLPESAGPEQICKAASSGDVPHLRLLHLCGVDPDKPDYDGRRPLHFAASKGKILAVSHLLGVSADPNVKDRWGHTPIDEGLLGGTRRHLKCAKLMEALGGKIGMYGRDEHEREMLERFNSIEMSEVRFLIKTLIEKGFDSMRITRTTDQQYYVAHEACVGLVPCAFEIQSLFVDVEQKLAEQVRPHQQLYDRLKSITGSCGRVIDKVNNSRLGPMDVGITAVIEMKEDGVKAKTQSFFEKLEQGIDITEFMNAVVDNDALALFEELDQIIASMEKKGRDSRQGKLMLAKEFNKALMNLNKVEDMWCELCNAFHAVAEQQNQVLLGSGYSRGVFLTYEMFPLFLEQIQLEVNHMEMRELFLSAVAPTLHNWEVQTVTPESLLCRSSKFRNIICKDCDAESSKLSTLVKSNVLRVLCFSHLKFLAWRSKTIHLGEGQKFKSDEPSMFIVKSGRVRTMFHNDGKDICLRLEYGSNTMFGEVWLLTGFAPILLIRATQKSELIQVKKSDIAVIVQARTQIVVALSQALSVESDFDKYEKEILHDSMQLEDFSSSNGSAKHSESNDDDDKDREQARDLVKVVADRAGSAKSNSFSLKIRKLMDRIHDHLQIHFLGPLQSISLALALWRGIAKSSRKRFTIVNSGVKDNPRGVIDCGIRIIDSAWDVFAAGLGIIFYNEVASVRQFLGEVGQNFFSTAFDPRKCPKEMNVVEWYTRWVKYIDDAEPEQSRSFFSSSFSVLKDLSHSQEAVAKEEKKDPEASGKQEQAVGAIEVLDHVLRIKDILTNKSISALLFHEDLLPAYEPTFCATVGNTAKAMARPQIQSFLSVLLTDFHGTICEFHVNEFLQVFSIDGHKANTITWPEIDRVLRDKNANLLRHERVFIGEKGSVFNPLSTPILCWRSIQQACAVLYFIFTPVQIAYLPFQSMTNPVLDAFNVTLDSLVFINLFVSLNIAYMNKQSRWVTERRKITKHFLAHEFWLDAFVATPFDWFGFISGASIQLCSWFRLPKLLYMVSMARESKPGYIQWNTSDQNVRLAILIGSVLHLISCFWFLMGRRGVGEVPSLPTWYEPPAASRRGGGGGGSATGSSQYTSYGGIYSNQSAAWDQYLLSFYWISSTVSGNGVIGDMNPQNYGEIGYTIFLLCIQLTLFNYVIGEISTGVLKGDEKLLKAREEIGAVESYLAGFELPNDLKLEIRRYFHGTSGASNFISASEIFDSVSHSLRMEISSNMTKERLDNVALFRGCSPQLKANIQGLVREIHFGSDEFLFQSNMVAHEMYFVVSGSVDQLMQDSEGNHVHDQTVPAGGSVGDLSFFFGVRHINSARASRSGAVCLQLVRAQIMPILQAYPDDEEIVAQNALRQFQLTKYARSAAGTSRYGKSVASFGTLRSAQEIIEDREAALVGNEEEISLPTAYEQSVVEEKNFDAVILSSIEQKVAFLNQRRKTEHIAAFCAAAGRGEIDKMERFLRIGLHVDETDSNGRTALHVAACEGQVEATKFLLQHRASSSIKDRYSNTALHDAVRHGHDQLAGLLRAQNQVLSFPSMEGGALLCKFAFLNEERQIDRFLTNGIDVNEHNYDGRTALHIAASEGHAELVQFLLDKAADVNCKDRRGASPLTDALRHGKVAVQQILRDAGGQLLGIDVASELCMAAATGDVKAMDALIRNRASPNSCDDLNRTALHLAASNGEITVLDFLLRRTSMEVNINPVDVYGGSPLEDAYREQQTVTIAMLEAHRAMRSDHPELLEMQDTQRKATLSLQRKERGPKVEEMIQGSEESKAQVWVRGRLGKLVPNQLSMVMAIYDQLDSDLDQLNSVLSKMEEKAADLAIKSGGKNKGGGGERSEEAEAALNELVSAAQSFLSTSSTWTEILSQIVKSTGEELPQVGIIIFSSHKYRTTAEELGGIFTKLINTSSFLEQTLHHLFQVLETKLPDELSEQEAAKRNKIERKMVDSLGFATKSLLQNVFRSL